MKLEAPSRGEGIAGKKSLSKKKKRKGSKRRQQHEAGSGKDAAEEEKDAEGDGAKGAQGGAKSKGSSSLMQQHRRTWQNEFKKLEDQEAKLKNDIVDKLRYISSTGLSNQDAAGQCLEDWIDYALGRTKFRESATSRMAWFRRILERRLGDTDDGDDDPEDVRSDFVAARREYRKVTSELDEAQREAEAEVKEAFDIPVLTKAKFAFARDVESELVSKFCGAERSKSQLLSELKQIDHKFQSKIKDIDKAHKLEEEPMGWTLDEDAAVQHALEQYPSQLGNRRALIMDWLKRRFPEKSVLDLSTYMTWCQNQKFHKEKVNSCIQEWERARGQWLSRALAAAAREPVPAAGNPVFARISKHPKGRARGMSLPPPVVKKPAPVAGVDNSSATVPELKKRTVLPRIGKPVARPPRDNTSEDKISQREREWRMRSLSTVRELEALKLKAREIGKKTEEDAQEVVRLKRRLSMERVKFRQEMAMKKQWDRMKAEQKRQEEMGKRKLKLQMKSQHERSQILQETNWLSKQQQSWQPSFPREATITRGRPSHTKKSKEKKVQVMLPLASATVLVPLHHHTKTTLYSTLSPLEETRTVLVSCRPVTRGGYR